jgi:adenylate kinase
MAAGHLVDDGVMLEIVTERLARPDTARGFVLDGYPRTVPQAEALDGLTRGRGPLVVLAMEVPVDVVVARMTARKICASCGQSAPPGANGAVACPRCGGALVMRSDDDRRVIRERLQVYERQTQPLVEYYRSRPTFFRIDANQPPDAVYAAFEQVLTPVRVGRPGAGA